MFDDLPPLRDVLAAGLTARRSLGQHFLLDLNLTRKIVRLAGVQPGEPVLEVGPGPGGLTRALLNAGAEVTAIEKDPRFLPALEALSALAEGRLRIIRADALDFDAAKAPPHPAIIANLPYNVASPLLVGWLTGALRPRSMTLMFQKEVAQRLAAAPGSKAYGRLSVLAQAICAVSLVMELPPRAFTPAPKVASAVVRLIPLSKRPSERVLGRLQQLTAAAFGQRRKMLRTSLRPFGGHELCARLALPSELRAEDVTVNQYLALAAALDDG